MDDILEVFPMIRFPLSLPSRVLTADVTAEALPIFQFRILYLPASLLPNMNIYSRWPMVYKM